MISIHKALAGLDCGLLHRMRKCGNFNPQGPRGPRQNPMPQYEIDTGISIHKALAGLDYVSVAFWPPGLLISIHKALAGLDWAAHGSNTCKYISIHKALAGLDQAAVTALEMTAISIHKALAGLDFSETLIIGDSSKFQSTRPSRASTNAMFNAADDINDFNPQGPRGPRLSTKSKFPGKPEFQSTRPSRASTSGDFIRTADGWAFQSTRPSRASTQTP